MRVAVIDTGIDIDHPDLTIRDGRNVVQHEDGIAYWDNGIGHGTHVAGIIAAHGAAPRGLRGLAPEVELWSFRVYGEGSSQAITYSIFKALYQVQLGEFDLVNLSFEAQNHDETLQLAVEEVQERGAVVIGAAGNGERQMVSSPARYATAVTALGRRGTYPPGALEEAYVGEPTGTDPEDFLASFSNFGQDVALTAPGLGIVSTVPGGYRPEDGTSMAAAAATGMAARLLSAHPKILSMPRDRERSLAIRNLLGQSAAKRGFDYTGEGFGML